MTAVGELLKLSRTMQATALLEKNLKAVKKKPKKKKLTKLALKNIVGTSLIKTQAQLSSGL